MMKRLIIISLLLAGFTTALMAQSCYWVLLTDKAGTTFDPYSYFDAKAIARYQLNNADLYDISNYPLNDSYVQKINDLATEEVGTSRWLNAIAVMATPDQIDAIRQLPFVKETSLIASEMQIAAYAAQASDDEQHTPATITIDNDNELPQLTDQLLRFQGDLFRNNGIDAKGIRIAVFDGGFPRVNTHAAFKHLRDNHQIIATWNFCNKKENVYGWNTHGTMVLSCIAGILNGKQLGLATGAEFLLARTEVNPEPFKEEVWWAQAAEWADKNGVDVINSSLGYGKERHYTHEMNGTSYVAKAANMAARKGILICNSAGNEGTDEHWITIITPADADSVLCVGGIIPSLTTYSHINFSSYGPSADGRLKPDISAFGYADVANPKNDSSMTNAYGTSFASPLCAGFCACAWQTRKGLTAMQMKSEIEKSCDRYPYFDYALGYGVPQASYFVNKEHAEVPPTFTWKDTAQFVIAVIPQLTSDETVPSNNDNQVSFRRLNIFEWYDAQKTVPSYDNKSLEVVVHNKRMSIYLDSLDQSQKEPSQSYNQPTTWSISDPNNTDVVFFKLQNDTNGIDIYDAMRIYNLDNEPYLIAFNKDVISNRTLWVNYRGYTSSYSLDNSNSTKSMRAGQNGQLFVTADTDFITRRDYNIDEERTPEDLITSNVSGQGGSEWTIEPAFAFGYAIHTQTNEMSLDGWARLNTHIDLRLVHNLCKNYGLGISLGWHENRWSVPTTNTPLSLTLLNNSLGLDDMAGSVYGDIALTSAILMRNAWGVELFQRVRFVSGGALFSRGLHWDLGLWGTIGHYNYLTTYNHADNTNLWIEGAINADAEERLFKHVDFADNYRWQWGLSTRITWDWIGVYARYNMTHLNDNGETQATTGVGFLNLPRFELGITIDL